jgi:EAL domain-containing protein (putative c-di-GMP-specific phosphodiesterase class I)
MIRLLLLDDDPAVTEALAAALRRPGRSILTCNDVEAAQVVLRHERADMIVADVQFSGTFGYEGLDFVREARELAPDATIVVMTGRPSPELEREAMSRGADLFLAKPFPAAAIERHLRDGDGEGGDRVIRVPMIDEIVRSPDLTTMFQPIYRLSEPLEVIGYEALARLAGGSPFALPELLFQYGARKKRIADLEIACMQRSLEASCALPGGAKLFLNVHPQVFGGPSGLAGTLRELLAGCDIDPARVVLEITEQSSIGDHVEAAKRIAELREVGVGFALDDMGIAYSHLLLIDEIRPLFLKVSQHFGTGFEGDPTRSKIVRNILALARELPAEVILEGIETARTAEAARELGITYGQGFHLARPAPVESFIATPRTG